MTNRRSHFFLRIAALQCSAVLAMLHASCSAVVQCSAVSRYRAGLLDGKHLLGAGLDPDKYNGGISIERFSSCGADQTHQ